MRQLGARSCVHSCLRTPRADKLCARSWGYSGPLTSAGIPDVSKEIHVDGSRPLPEAQQDIRAYNNATVRGFFEGLEGRLNRFGYSFSAPFVTECGMETRRAFACPTRTLR